MIAEGAKRPPSASAIFPPPSVRMVCRTASQATGVLSALVAEGIIARRSIGRWGMLNLPGRRM